MEPLDDQARALIDQLRAHGFRPAHQVPGAGTGPVRVIFVQYVVVRGGLTCIVCSRALGAKAVRVDRC